MEDDLVDIFYYDFVLSKIIEIYKSNQAPSVVVPYLRIATPLSKKFREQKKELDKEVYLKEGFIKVYQLLISLNHNKSILLENNIIGKSLECLDLILRDCPSLEAEKDYKTIRCVGYSVYLMKKNAKGNEESDKIEKKLKSLSTEETKLIHERVNSFDCNDCIELLSTIKFRHSRLKTFVSSIKKEIDENQFKKNITSNNSPGDKINWK